MSRPYHNNSPYEHTCNLPQLLTALKMPSETTYSFSESFVISEVRLGVNIAIPIKIKETQTKIHFISVEVVSINMPILRNGVN
jgi:starvation-inducible outer membrane lipoprotein